VGAIKRRRFPASLCLLFLPHLHATSTGTTGSARIHCISPRLPHSLHPTSVDQNAVASVLSLSFQIDESSDGGLVTSINTFLELDGVDLLFDEPHLGGKDNLPLSVISIVHQQWANSSVMLILPITPLSECSKIRTTSRLRRRLASWLEL